MVDFAALHSKVRIGRPCGDSGTFRILLPMLDQLKAGQQLQVTITREPRRTADRKTIERLMRLDPDTKRALTHAQRHRERTLVVRSRGKRPWAVRRHPSKLVRAAKGETWTMTYFPHVAPELRCVSSFLSFKTP